MRQRKRHLPIKRLAALCLVLLLAASLLPPLAAYAQSGGKVVRVGADLLLHGGREDQLL